MWRFGQKLIAWMATRMGAGGLRALKGTAKWAPTIGKLADGALDVFAFATLFDFLVDDDKGQPPAEHNFDEAIEVWAGHEKLDPRSPMSRLSDAQLFNLISAIENRGAIGAAVLLDKVLRVTLSDNGPLALPSGGDDDASITALVPTSPSAHDISALVDPVELVCGALALDPSRLPAFLNALRVVVAADPELIRVVGSLRSARAGRY